MDNWLGGVLTLLGVIGFVILICVVELKLATKNKEDSNKIEEKTVDTTERVTVAPVNADGPEEKTADSTQSNSAAPVNTDEEKGMWANIGGKCKTLAAVSCWLGIIGCIIYGIILIAQGSAIRNGESLIISGFLVAIVGSFASYLGSIGLYAIGEAAEKSAYAAKYIEKLEAEKKEKENKTE